MNNQQFMDLALFFYYAFGLAVIFAIVGAIAEWIEKRNRR